MSLVIQALQYRTRRAPCHLRAAMLSLTSSIEARGRACGLVVAAAAMAAWALAAAGAEARTVAVSADRLLDVSTGRYVDKPLVVIVDGRISAVEHQGDAVPAKPNGWTCRGSRCCPA